jgi:general secretion pathway protein L
VVALVPARHLSWHQVQLPKGTLTRRFWQDGNPQRLRHVLEGLLEDRLLDDPAQLHFALAPRPDPDAPVWVAVCDRTWLRDALQTLENAGLAPSRVVPEFAPGERADQLFVTGDAGAPQVVCTARGGVAVWPLSPAAVALLNWPPEQALLAEPAVAAVAEQAFKRMVTLQQSALRQVQALQTAWDLAQFDLVNSSRARTLKRGAAAVRSFGQAPRWRPARLALVALVAVNLAGLNAWAWKEQAVLQARQTAIKQVLTSTFPSVPVVVDAPVQMARAVAALQQANGAPTGRDLESLLGALGALAPVAYVPRAIEFAAGELRLTGLPDGYDDLAFKLKAQGYTARIDRDKLLIQQGVAP